MSNIKKRKGIRSFIDVTVTFIAVCMLFLGFRYFIRFPVVNGNSMEPTYHDGDRLMVFYTKNVDLNDIVVVWSESLDDYIIKRVAGVPGDRIEIKAGALYRNGTMLYESYIKERSWQSADDIMIELAEDEYFLLGDNRNHSTDSRSFGTVKKDDIFGKVLQCIKYEE